MDASSNICKNCGAEEQTLDDSVQVCGRCMNRSSWYWRNRELVSEKAKLNYRKNSELAKERAKQWRANQHPLYYTWMNMNGRCNNASDKDYKKYGLRGIRVHSDWCRDKGHSNEAMLKNQSALSSFVDYIEEKLGPKPGPYHTIDRIDNDGNYEPGNLRWATPSEQSNNTRVVRQYRDSIPADSIVNHGGESLTLMEFSDLTNIPLDVVKYRYALYPESNYILSDPPSKSSVRYRGRMYSVVELAIIAGLKYSTIRMRLDKPGWSVEDCVEKPIRYTDKE